MTHTMNISPICTQRKYTEMDKARDITLERILSLIPKKPDGKFVHGAKKEFCLEIGAPANIVNMWERGVSNSYNNYLYAISAKYNVSVEWLKGETDIKRPFDVQLFASDKEKLIAALDTMSREEVLEIMSKAMEVLKKKE